MPEVLEQPAIQPRKGRPITTQNARELQARSVAARLLRSAIPEPKPQIAPQQSPFYTDERIARVRAQLDRIDKMLLEAEATQDIERLSRAAGTLSEQLRILEDKPLPGSRKPAAERRPRIAEFAPEPQDLPSSKPSCGQDTPTGSVPSSASNQSTPQSS